jgi:hypothetical protein
MVRVEETAVIAAIYGATKGQGTLVLVLEYEGVYLTRSAQYVRQAGCKSRAYCSHSPNPTGATL